VDRRNLLVKVPGTPAGVSAFEALTMLGINVNVTLLFSIKQTEAVFAAYIRGLTARAHSGADVRRSKAVASLFLSRVDTLVDTRLDAIGTAGGEGAAWQDRGGHGQARLSTLSADLSRGSDLPRCQSNRIARPQYLLWASTGVKNPEYPDLLYVEPLIGPETVNTLPDKTLAALRDHGQAARRLEEGIAEAETHLADLKRLGIDLEEVGATLQDEGVKSFEVAYQKLLEQTG
jgi:transaldolase